MRIEKIWHCYNKNCQKLLYISSHICYRLVAELKQKLFEKSDDFSSSRPEYANVGQTCSGIIVPGGVGVKISDDGLSTFWGQFQIGRGDIRIKARNASAE